MRILIPAICRLSAEISIFELQMNKSDEKNTTARFAKQLIYRQIKALSWKSFWSLSLAVGGLFLAAFFVSIEYLPDFDLQSLTGVIACVALVGTFLVMFVGLGLIAPAFVLRPIPGQKKWAALIESMFGVASAFALFCMIGFSDQLAWYAWTGFAVLTASLCVGTVYFCAPVADDGNRAKAWVYSFFRILFWAVWVLLNPILLSSILLQNRGEGWLIAYSMVLLLALTYTIISQALVFASDNLRKIGIPLAAVFSALYLAIYSSQPAFFPHVAVSALGLSLDRQSAVLVVSPRVCSAVNIGIGAHPCTYDKQADAGRISDVYIISRIGTELLARWKHSEDESTWQRLILKKEDVIFWTYKTKSNS